MNNSQFMIRVGISVLAFVIVILVVLFGFESNPFSSDKVTNEPQDEDSILQRIEPVGQMNIEKSAAQAETKPEATPLPTTADDEPTAAPEVAAAEPAPAPAPTESTPEVAAQSSADGEKVYNATCQACHNPAIATALKAPGLGDKAAWSDRLTQGAEVLFEHAIKVPGYQGSQGGFMPARGGNASLSDDEVRAAIGYMIKQVQ